MSKVWLCQDFLAKYPLRVRADVSVYSFEELCFYLYHHAETVEESFFNEMLCQWLDQEIGRTELALGTSADGGRLLYQAGDYQSSAAGKDHGK